jgi:hypothetical protein
VLSHFVSRGNIAMPVAEITAGITTVRAAIDVAKGMLTVRDAKLVAAKADELRQLLGDAISKLLNAQQGQMAQLEQIQVLKAEAAKFRDWDSEKQKYELKGVGQGVFAYMPKSAARGDQPPHWLCPTCFESGKKAYFQFSTRMSAGGSVYRCKGCEGHMVTNSEPAWL